MMDKDQGNESTNRFVWDCGSSLYDSFELKSLMRQLDPAVAFRCLSMPHFPVTPPPPPPPPPAPARARKKRSKLAKYLENMIRSVLRLKHKHAGGGASSSSEVKEKGRSSPEPSRMARKSLSERFAGTTAVALTAIEIMRDM